MRVSIFRPVRLFLPEAQSVKGSSASLRGAAGKIVRAAPAKTERLHLPAPRGHASIVLCGRGNAINVQQCQVEITMTVRCRSLWLASLTLCVWFHETLTDR